MKKIYYSFLRIVGRKEKKYRIFLSCILIIGLFAAWKLLLLSQAVYRDIKMRTPLNDNSYVVLEVPTVTATLFPVGTPLYSYDPKFELAGFVSSIEDSHKQSYKYIGVSVLEKHKRKIMQQKTVFKLLNTSPSFYAILSQSIQQNNADQYLFSIPAHYKAKLEEKTIGHNLGNEFSDRGFSIESNKIKIEQPGTAWNIVEEKAKGNQVHFFVREEKGELRVYGGWNKLAAMISNEQGKNYGKVASIFVEKLKKHGVDADKAQQIFNDSYIQEQLYATLNVEILQKIDFEKALKDVPQSKEAQQLLGDVNFDNIMFSAAEGLLVGGKDYLYQEANKYESKTYFGDVMNWGYLTYRMVFNRDEMLNKGFKHAGGKALELGWGQTFRSLKDTVKKNPRAAENLSKDVVSKLDLGANLGSGLGALLSNDKLKTYIQNKYGKESLEAFILATQEMVVDENVSNLLQGTKEIVEKQVVNMTSGVLLNKNKSGINPIFLTFARERLLGKKEPQVIYFSKPEDVAVQNGHTYKWYDKKTEEGSVISYLEGEIDGK